MAIDDNRDKQRITGSVGGAGNTAGEGTRLGGTPTLNSQNTNTKTGKPKKKLSPVNGNGIKRKTFGSGNEPTVNTRVDIVPNAREKPVALPEPPRQGRFSTAKPGMERPKEFSEKLSDFGDGITNAFNKNEPLGGSIDSFSKRVTGTGGGLLGGAKQLLVEGGRGWLGMGEKVIPLLVGKEAAEKGKDFLLNTKRPLDTRDEGATKTKKSATTSSFYKGVGEQGETKYSDSPFEGAKEFTPGALSTFKSGKLGSGLNAMKDLTSYLENRYEGSAANMARQRNAGPERITEWEKEKNALQRKRDMEELMSPGKRTRFGTATMKYGPSVIKSVLGKWDDQDKNELNAQNNIRDNFNTSNIARRTSEASVRKDRSLLGAKGAELRQKDIKLGIEEGTLSMNEEAAVDDVLKAVGGGGMDRSQGFTRVAERVGIERAMRLFPDMAELYKQGKI